MVKPRTSSSRRHRGIAFLWSLFFSLTLISARAAMQFDVFPGYDGVVPEASWFPVICEVKNDGPSFTGVIEVSAGQFNESQTRRIVVELPTGTLKRVLLPVFSTARYQSSWNVRLLDERGHVRAEQPGIRPRRQIAAGGSVIGALPRTPTGVPVLQPIRANDSDLQPATARMLPALMPDNPLTLEGLDTFYLNSERASELGVQQVSALLAWLNNGGHLILGLEQISDVNATSWLRKIVPCELTDMRTVQSHRELQTWLRGVANRDRSTAKSQNSVANILANFNPYSDVPEDHAFEIADLQVITGTVHDGVATVSAGGTPLMLDSHQGRGRVTTLMFSPERKPFSAWNNLPSFWSKLTEVSPELYTADNNNAPNLRGGWSIDGVFGAMIDSKQVRKLPVEWLLLLLIIYLVVIGPLDQYWLKRIKRPMLTWITFPCYVVLFSLLIYFIGYKLRAGDTEWNEIHLVDVLMNGDGAELRGHSYASIYSPVNATYRVENRQHYSTFRGELQSSWNGGGQDSEHAQIVQVGDNFDAEISVPVWTSQLYASDWWQSADLPLKLKVTPEGDGWSVEVNNLRDRPLNHVCVIIGDHLMQLGELAANQSKTVKMSSAKGDTLGQFLTQHAANFQSASQSRQRAFGSSGGSQLPDLPESAEAVSLITSFPGERFILPPGLDMSSLLNQGNAILLAWEPGYSPIKPLNQFSASRGQKNTLWRVAVPINGAP